MLFIDMAKTVPLWVLAGNDCVTAVARMLDNCLRASLRENPPDGLKESLEGYAQTQASNGGDVPGIALLAWVLEEIGFNNPRKTKHEGFDVRLNVETGVVSWLKECNRINAYF